MSSFCHWEGDTLVLNILGRPRAKKTKIGKVIGHQLEVHAAENPVRGRATAHLVKFLAEEFEVPESAITVSRLLKSCATPPASWPTASIF